MVIIRFAPPLVSNEEQIREPTKIIKETILSFKYGSTVILVVVKLILR